MKNEEELQEELQKIKRSNNQYSIKASVCKLASKRWEMYNYLPGAIEHLRLAILYQEKIKMPKEINEIELAGLKSHLKYIERKLKRTNNA
jgi:hypothetical protein